MKEILEGPSLVHYLVKKLKEKYPEKQVGKTVVQKLMFLLETQSNLDFDYTLYHYGPYSPQVGEYINLAEALGFISVRWEHGKGYFLEPLQPNKKLLYDVKELQKLIDKIVNSYGKFTANELSIIATAIYIKNKYNIKSSGELIDAVLRAKPANKKDWIEKILMEAKVIESN